MEPTGGDWERLPEVLLPIIFNNLQIEKKKSMWNYHSRQVNKSALLNCRLVNKTWKKEMDRVLEKLCLDEFWRIWKPEQAHFLAKSHNFPVLILRGDTESWLTFKTGLNFLEKNLFQSSPIPTKSLCVKPIVGPPGRLIENANFFSTVGIHLTSITLNSMCGFSLKIVAKLLGHTPNLKAMDLDTNGLNVKEGSPTPPRLPPLLQLFHLGLWGRCGGKYDDFDMVTWVLEPYEKQIVSLVTNCGIEKGDDDPAAYQKVEQLKLLCEHPYIAVNFSIPIFPPLPSLSLVEVRLEEELTLDLIWNFLCKHKSTLLHLFLDFSRNRVPVNKPTISYSDWSSSVSAKVTTFPKLKSLSIFYPNFNEEVVMIKEFLRMTPKLEHLKLLNFDKYRRNYTTTDQDMKTARKHLENEKNYVQLCPILKFISVQINLQERYTFLRCEIGKPSSYQELHQHDF